MSTQVGSWAGGGGWRGRGRDLLAAPKGERQALKPAGEAVALQVPGLRTCPVRTGTEKVRSGGESGPTPGMAWG